MMMESGENLLQLTQHRRQWKLECFMNLVQLKLQKSDLHYTKNLINSGEKFRFGVTCRGLVGDLELNNYRHGGSR